MSARKLSPKQAAFVAEYLIDLNATQAAIRAGYSEKTADRIGAQLLGKTWVREALEKAQARRAEKVERTALDVLKDIQSVTREAREGGDLKPALKGLELEGKHLGMFLNRVDMTSSDGSMTQAPAVVIDFSGMSPDDIAAAARAAFKGE